MYVHVHDSLLLDHCSMVPRYPGPGDLHPALHNAVHLPPGHVPASRDERERPEDRQRVCEVTGRREEHPLVSVAVPRRKAAQDVLIQLHSAFWCR